MTITLDGNSLTIQAIAAVARQYQSARLSRAARTRMLASHRVILHKIRQGQQVYGINTGFGKLSDRSIASEDIGQLQINLIRSHACGVGEPLPEEVVRAAMLIRANTLAKGFSGIRPIVTETLLDMLEHRLHPVVPRKGSVGASGDLAPSAHLGLAMIGEGDMLFRGRRVKARRALQSTGIQPLILEAKEGLSILNGTHFICGVGSLAFDRAWHALVAADVAGALSLEPLLGTTAAFDARIQRVRAHKGQAEVAEHLRNLTSGSGIIASHHGCGRVQDAYSLRCMPQVHGAARDVLGYVRQVLEIEINSATDNPLVFPEDGAILSGGNFHGAPVALALDFAAMALAQVGTMSERRVERLVNPDLSGLPAFLTRQAGLASGLMIPQVVAAALASENKGLANPASADTIPTSAAKEDHVSMGMIAALKLATSAENLESIIAIEMLCACQAIDLLEIPGSPGPGRGTAKAHALIREVVKELGEDRPLSADIGRISGLIQSGAFDKLI
jgi:histidine ammonia-lyase